MDYINPILTQKKKNYFEIILTVILIVLIVFLISILSLRAVFSVYQVEQTSMTPTIMHQDFVVVNKLDNPQLGDVIVINRESDSPVIKRLFGFGGDTIEIENGIVKVNDNVINEPYVKFTKVENMIPTTVPEGMIFVMGDNRAGSSDSRDKEFGFLKEKDIVGVVPTWVIKNKDKNWFKVFVNIIDLRFLRDFLSDIGVMKNEKNSFYRW